MTCYASAMADNVSPSRQSTGVVVEKCAVARALHLLPANRNSRETKTHCFQAASPTHPGTSISSLSRCGNRHGTHRLAEYSLHRLLVQAKCATVHFYIYLEYEKKYL